MSILTNKKNKIDNNSSFTKELNAINSKVLNYAILITVLFSIPSILNLINKINQVGFNPIQFIYFFLAISAVVLYFFKRRIKFKTRFFLFISLLILLALTAMIDVGSIGFWPNYIILIVLIITLFYRNIYSFIVFGIFLSLIILTAYLYYNKYFIYSFDILIYANSIIAWSTLISTLIFTSMIVIFTVDMQRRFFISTIKQLTLEKEKVQRSEQKFKNIFDSSTEGIIISDFEGHILETNQALLNFMNLTKDQLNDKTIRDFVLPEYHAIMKERTESLIPNESPPLLEMQVKNFKSETVPVEINMILIDYNNQKAVFSVIRDITERKKMEQNILSTIIQTEEKERSRLAKELHDGVGPLLSATKIYAKALPNADNEEERVYTIMKLNETVNEAIISAQEIANNISPHVLRNFGLKGAIESFYQKINKISSFTFDFHSNLEERINENIETILYRVVVELINNTIKYANAKLVTVILIIDENKISLNYSDDGKGFDLEKTKKMSTSMGLSNIYSRIKSLNGQIIMYSEKNKGFEVDVKIDL